MKNHFPKIIAALSPLQGLKALQKIDRCTKHYWGETWRKRSRSLAKKGSRQPGMQLCLAFGALFLHAQRMESPESSVQLLLCKEGPVPQDPSPAPCSEP